MAQLTVFGKDVKKKLVDIDQTQEWLIDRVKENTGMFFDGSYLSKILTGQRNAPAIKESICKVLNIEQKGASK